MGGSGNPFNVVRGAIKTAIDAQTLDVVRERLAFASDQLTAAEKKADSLESDNSDLLRENEALKAKVLKYESRPRMVDIGPCAVKLDKKGRPLLGFYCNACESLLDRAIYSSFEGESFCCQKCNDFRAGWVVDEAFALHFGQEDTA